AACKLLPTTLGSNMLWIHVFLLLQLGFFSAVSSEKILAWPADASHWLNLRLILEELAHKGHEVTALVHSANMLIDHNLPSAIKAEVFPVAFTKETFLTLQRDFFNFWIYGIHNMSYWELYEHLKVAVASSLKLQRDTCDGVLKNKELMYKLQNQKFDIVVADPVAPCGELIAESLGVPFVYSFRFSMGNSLERLCGQLPSPFSYVPGAMTALSDKMSFGQRLANTVLYAFQDLIFSLVFQKNWDNYYSEILGKQHQTPPTQGAEIWLIRTYWDFEYPRPILPNFKFVGGLHCAPAKPLPEEIEKVVESSGEHGIVVFSMGSMIKNFSDERTNIIAAALSQLPQKVLWRYSGKKPDALGENTITYDWIPQNDLLGHPKTKAFITHGGTNGIYEAIYHRVPIVGIPLFAEQPDNIVHMKSKGMAIMLDFNKMGTQDLLDAVNTVINNPTYKENAMRLSRIHHDQPVKPLDSAVFWIEFVMRHKGAKHLRPASHELTWYQYHCLDVIGFMFVCLLLFFYITITFLTFCYKKCCRTTKEKNQ
uniref:glucuronosyltransferase n=1 Tax=Xenopus tropicalis TaxID=8364 RepID=A0A5S6LXS6_XENTR